MKPLLLRENQKLRDPKLLETFLSIQEKDAKQYIKNQMSQPQNLKELHVKKKSVVK